MSLPLRQAVLTALSAADGVSELGAAVYPQAPVDTPVWPFYRYGAPSVVPREASCIGRGESVSLVIHGFAKPRYDTGELVETAEDVCHRMARAAKVALHRTHLDLSDGARANLRYTSHTIIPDGATPDAFHAIVNFTARILATT
jgi:Protein of unknown function (DUF3168)